MTVSQFFLKKYNEYDYDLISIQRKSYCQRRSEELICAVSYSLLMTVLTECFDSLFYTCKCWLTFRLISQKSITSNTILTKVQTFFFLIYGLILRTPYCGAFPQKKIRITKLIVPEVGFTISGMDS